MPPTPSARLMALPSQIRGLLFSQSSRRLGNLPAVPLRFPSSSTIPQHLYATSAPDTSTADGDGSSVNQTEVSHFNSLASSWWDPHGSSRVLHLMNPLRHEFIKRCLAQEQRDPTHKLSYLDIGCGGGIFAESAARLSNTESVTAIDPTPEVIAVAKRHQRADPLLLEPGRLSYINTAIEDLPNHTTQQFDIISLFEVIEHVQRPSPFLRSCLAHLKPGGWLIGSTIARTQVSWFTTKFVAEDVLRMVPRGTHDWNQYIQPQELLNWTRAQGDLLTSDGLGWQIMGVVYLPGVGWKEVEGSENWGNYFFGIKKQDEPR